MPSMNARPASGLSSVVRIRTAVVLPAPFGPSSPSTWPRSIERSTPRSASVSPKRLVSPSATTVGIASTLPSRRVRTPRCSILEPVTAARVLAVRRVASRTASPRGQTEAMDWRRSSTVDHLPDDPVGEVVTATLVEIFRARRCSSSTPPTTRRRPTPPDGLGVAARPARARPGGASRCTLTLLGPHRRAPLAREHAGPRTARALPSAAIARREPRSGRRGAEARRSARRYGARCATRSSSS